jgi:hypothetical protein
VYAKVNKLFQWGLYCVCAHRALLARAISRLFVRNFPGPDNMYVDSIIFHLIPAKKINNHDGAEMNKFHFSTPQPSLFDAAAFTL